MIVVLDSNALVQIFGAESPLLPLQVAILEGRLSLAMSNEILLEYEEVLTRYGGAERWRRVWRVLEMTGQLHDNVLHVEPSYHWRIIFADPDDNKFVDCAIAAQADWIITEDRHFAAVRNSGQRPQPITPEAFIREVLVKL